MKQTRLKHLLYVVRQQEETEWYAGCQLTLRAFAWQQIGRKSWLLFQGFWDVFMQSLILALVYLPGIRAPPCIHWQLGKLVHQKVAASALVFHCKQSVQGGKHALRMAA